MSIALSKKLLKVGNDEHGHQYWFYCPGCEMEHAFDNKWKWNGDPINITISPSLLVNGVGNNSNRRCHSFIKEGKIQFLSDCFHKLKSQTVIIPDLPEWALEFWEEDTNQK